MTQVEPRYRPRANAIFAELGDGSGVILDLQTKLYFDLNASGAFIWKEIAIAPKAATELARRLAESFTVQLPEAEADARRLLESLLAEALIEPDAP